MLFLLLFIIVIFYHVNNVIFVNYMEILIIILYFQLISPSWGDDGEVVRTRRQQPVNMPQITGQDIFYYFCFFSFKGTVRIISRDPPCKDDILTCLHLFRINNYVYYAYSPFKLNFTRNLVFVYQKDYNISIDGL